MGGCSVYPLQSLVRSSLSAAFLSAVLLLILSPTPASSLNVVKLGADPTGKRGSTKSFLTAWNQACASTIPTVINVPKGRYQVGAVKFQGPCKNSNITFVIHGTLVAPSNINTLTQFGYWIFFNSVTGVNVFGGTIDGSGSSLWKCKLSKGRCPNPVNNMNINRSQRVLIKGLTSVNPQMFHFQLHRCNGVTMDGLRIIAPGNSPNTDGIHVQYSNAVKITGPVITTGDDCISVGAGTTNLNIERVTCGPGHGISIGSLANFPSEPGVENVMVKSVTMTGTQNGVRIKTWAKPSAAVVKNIVFQDIVMKNVGNPIIIDQNYCPSGSCAKGSSGVKISGVSYRNIRGTSSSAVAVKLDCSPSKPCTGIQLAGISLTFNGGQPAVSFCRNAHGSASGFVNPPSCL